MTAVALHYLEQGSGPPVVILHGLFGSSRNWASISRELSGQAHVFSVDLRNHGESPRTQSHTLDDLAEDLLLFLKKVGTPTVIGHSMGGLAAMKAGLLEPAAFRGLVIVDIAPRSYAPRHQKEFAALREDLGACQSRQEVDALMSRHLPDPMIRQFLQMNLARDAQDRFYWKIPVETLERAAFIETFPEEGQYDGPALFIAGGQSDYLGPSDLPLIRRRFPGAQIEAVAGAGHWPHYSHPAEFLALVRSFLARLP